MESEKFLEPRLREALVRKVTKQRVSKIRYDSGLESILAKLFKSGFKGYDNISDQELLNEMLSDVKEKAKGRYYDVPPGVELAVMDRAAFIEHLTVQEVTEVLTDAS